MAEEVLLKLDKAEDLSEIMDLMRDLNIPTKGCKTEEQMKKRIIKHLQSEDYNPPAANEVRSQVTITGK